MFSPMYFNDLSSVHYANDHMIPGFVQLKSVHERYSQELPSLRAIHEESQGFIPVHPVRVPPAYPAVMPAAVARSRAKLLPRHARIARSAPELDYLDRSPESRSSSSGFGSKNTSSQQNQSSQSGSTFLEWKLPPYRHPPPAPAAAGATLPPPPPGAHWLLELGSSSSPSMSLKAVDVDYEFDPATPTPTPSGAGDPLDLDAASSYNRSKAGYTPKYTRYDNIDARVRAMKEEFNEFRKRQAKRRRTGELESIC